MQKCQAKLFKSLERNLILQESLFSFKTLKKILSIYMKRGDNIAKGSESLHSLYKHQPFKLTWPGNGIPEFV